MSDKLKLAKLTWPTGAVEISDLEGLSKALGDYMKDSEIGDEVEILNLGANAVTVYPPTSSARINALSAGAGFLLATNTAVKLRKFTATRWAGYLSA